VDYRNGYRRRNLVTAFGLIKGLVVPRTERGGYQTKVFQRYRRRWQRVDRFIWEVFIGGVSIRAVGWVMGSLLDKGVIDYRLARSESEHEWTVLLNSLYRRGLRGECLRLVITDGCKGLQVALSG